MTPHDPQPDLFAPGTQLGQYTILELLGRGGMGEVYKATDTRLKRLVAIKVVRSSSCPNSQDHLRLLQEARAAAALNHPNIVQVFGLEHYAGNDCIVMEFVEGRTLRDLISSAKATVPDALRYSTQMASALAAAHVANIVHRDIKPGNILVSDAGIVKVLDFGLAKLQPVIIQTDATLTAGPQTAAGTVVGTAAYMSPEQALGQPVDARSDVFSLGVVLYELFTGQQAFQHESVMGLLARVIRDQPAAVRSLRPEVPTGVEQIITRCMEKDPHARYASGAEVHQALLALQQHSTPPVSRALVATLGLLLVAVIGAAVFFYQRYSTARWVRNEALPQIQRLLGQDDYTGAFDLVRTASRRLPDDPQLKQYWQEVAFVVSMNTRPSGARVSFRQYGEPDKPWRLLGVTPLREVPLPQMQIAVRIEKEGFVPYEFSTLSAFLANQTIPLDRPGDRPQGTLPVLENAPWIPTAAMKLPDYFIDEFEVTNGQFQQFIAAGGYDKKEYWREPFRKGNRDLPFEQAVQLFRDRTGKPGPSPWELGVFAKEHGQDPVGGVSWYEAAAYCEYAKKALPTIHHWRRASGFNNAPNAILLHSNFMSSGPAPVGKYPGLSFFGAYDMAGNMKEWCRNEVSGKRAVLGGAWNEPSYKFADDDAQDPFAREATFGFRCAVYPTPPPAASLEPMQRSSRDYANEKPVSDESFRMIQRLYAYDREPVDGRTERVDETNEDWRLEKVSYRAAYNGERIPAFLYIPRNAKPPYQTVIWFPGGYAMGMRNSEGGGNGTQFFNFLPRTGRAVLFPVYKGTFERRSTEGGEGPNAFRDAMIYYSKDLSRSVDYLESRSDIQGGNLAYFGLSTGGFFAPILLANEPRFKAAILAAGGFFRNSVPPEVDPINFAPRAHMPVLLLNGRYDFFDPLELQQALLHFMGANPADKRHVLSESGHVPPIQDLMREVLSWLDKYQGPVQK